MRSKIEYKVWLKHRNEKNLIRRTREKYYRKRQLTKKYTYNALNKKTASKSGTYDTVFKAPLTFSFVENKEETIAFFEDLINFISDKRNFGKSLFIDISYIHQLTTDALMYLLAIVNNLNANFSKKYNFSGNAPNEESVRSKFNESGFYNFVKHRNDISLEYKSDKVQIVTGDNSNTEIAKQLSDFVSNKGGIPQTVNRFLYTTMIELMSNTHKHAYNNNDAILPRWYCFAEYDGDDIIVFTFMDTGAGIPSTVRKKFIEKIDILGLKGDSSYVTSALNGDFRTETGHYFRGKGLPKIKLFCKDRKIQNLRIITNKADVSIEGASVHSMENTKSLRGTLYRWEVSLQHLRGEKV